MHVVRKDGSPVLALGVSPLIAAAVLVTVLGAGAAVALLVRDWQALRRQSAESAQALDAARGTHRSAIDSIARQVTELRRQVGSWRALHARILEPFGPPAAGPAGPHTGIGGVGTPPPPRPAVAVSPLAELDALAQDVADVADSLRSLDRLVARAARALASLPASWPVRGAVNSEFGVRLSPWSRASEFHSGIDIAASRGTAVLAPAAGTVVQAGRHRDYGLLVVLDHGQDVRTTYGHLSRITVEPGQRVARGALIGAVGTTGRTSGPHLHYEIVVAGQPVNPRSFLWD